MNANVTMLNEATSSIRDNEHFLSTDRKIEFDSSVTNQTNKTPTFSVRRVQFQTIECVHHVTGDENASSGRTHELDSADNNNDDDDVHDDDDDDDEVSHLWYNTEDFKKFRSDDKRLMKVYRNLLKQKQRIPVGEMDDENMKFIDEKIVNLEDEIRGLEDYKSVRANIDFKHRRHACCDAVMKEQAKQQKLFRFQQKRMKINDETTDDITWSSAREFVLDVTSIRKCVLNTSMKSKLLAFTLGLADADYVRQMNNVDAASVVEDEVEVNDKRLDRCIVEVDEQRAYRFVKVPPRCDDVDDMTLSPVSRCNTVSPIPGERTTASSILRNLQRRHLTIKTSYISCS